MSVTPANIELFRRSVTLFRASPMTKLLSSPARLGLSFARDSWCRARRRVKRGTATTFWGDTMNVVFPERGSTAIYRYRFIEEGLTSIFLHCVKPGMTVFDIGAHFGYFTLLAAKLVGERGQVHSFDPTPSTVEVLKSNVGGRPNVRVNQVAVFSRRDTLRFNDFGVEYSQFNSVGSGRLAIDSVQPTPCDVQAITLDSYVTESAAPPDFIKIDAENAELEILKGASNVLEKVRPMITLEVGDLGSDQASAAPIGYLLERDYRAMEYRDGALREHQPREKYGYDNLLFVPREKQA